MVAVVVGGVRVVVVGDGVLVGWLVVVVVVAEWSKILCLVLVESVPDCHLSTRTRLRECEREGGGQNGKHEGGETIYQRSGPCLVCWSWWWG
jgi:hypothetical protein